MDNANSRIHRRGTEDAEYPQREITDQILAAAFEVHSQLGAGLLEAVYREALSHELHLRGLSVAREVEVPLQYKGVALRAPFRLDLLVSGEVIVEAKTVDALGPIHTAQLLTYLRLTGKTVGLLINFNTAHLRDGIRRVVNSLRSSASPVPLR
ncbi:MAG: GxxExxY protein [Pseudomonadota bacterium]